VILTTVELLMLLYGIVFVDIFVLELGFLAAEKAEGGAEEVGVA
jgi:hypothetical protein